MTKTGVFYSAAIQMPPESGSGPMETYWFVSLDGQNYREVGDDPREYPYEAVDELFNPKTPQKTLPMTIARGFLRSRGATFYDPKED